MSDKPVITPLSHAEIVAIIERQERWFDGMKFTSRDVELPRVFATLRDQAERIAVLEDTVAELRSANPGTTENAERLDRIERAIHALITEFAIHRHAPEQQEPARAWTDYVSTGRRQ